jgi:hypothetical protein
MIVGLRRPVRLGARNSGEWCRLRVDEVLGDALACKTQWLLRSSVASV